MPVKQPILGYESKTAAARALKAQGLKAPEIAMRMGISPSSAAALVAYRVKNSGRTIVISGDTLDKLTSHAERREISVNELVRRIVDTVADENMVDNVLDDLEGAKNARS